MPETTKPITPKSSSAKQPNPWQWISVALAIGLVVSVGMQLASKQALTDQLSGDTDFEAGDSTSVANGLVNFLNLAYGEQVGVSSLQAVEESHGLYQVTVVVDDNGTPTPQVVHVTRDGAYFIPQVVDIDDIITQIQQLAEQQQAADAVPQEDGQPIQ